MKPNALRVAILSQRYLPLIGGIEHQQGAIAPLLRASGIDARVVTKRYPGLPAYEEIQGVPVHRFPVPPPRPLASLSYTLTAQPFLARFKPHILHAHEVFSPATTALLGKLLTGSRIVLTPASSGAFSEITRLKNNEMGNLRLKLLRQHVDGWITLSGIIDRELAGAGIPAERRHPVPNGVDTQHFTPLDASKKQALCRSLNLPDGPLVVWTGRISPEKRVDLLLSAWHAIQMDGKISANLLIVGEGSQESDIRAMAAGTRGVFFTGAVDDVAPYLQTADIFALPSDAEGLSVSMLEAMACGLAVAATDVGAAREVVEDGITALLVPPGDAAALKTALITLLENNDRRALMGRLARQVVEARFHLPVVCEQLTAVYQTIAKRASEVEVA